MVCVIYFFVKKVFFYFTFYFVTFLNSKLAKYFKEFVTPNLISFERKQLVVFYPPYFNLTRGIFLLYVTLYNLA